MVALCGGCMALAGTCLALMVHLSERRRLGKPSVYLPPLGIGCAPIGEIYDRISDQQAADTLDAALRKGIRYFDVAPSYGAGLAEILYVTHITMRAANTIHGLRRPLTHFLQSYSYYSTVGKKKKDGD